MENSIFNMVWLAAIFLFVAGLDLGTIIGQRIQTNKFYSWTGFICLSIAGIGILLGYYLVVRNP